MAELSEQAKRFLKVWWESSSIDEVAEAYMDDYPNETKEKIKQKLQNRAMILRGKKVPLKKFRQGIGTVDPTQAKAYLLELGIPANELGIEEAAKPVKKAAKKKATR